MRSSTKVVGTLSTLHSRASDRVVQRIDFDHLHPSGETCGQCPECGFLRGLARDAVRRGEVQHARGAGCELRQPSTLPTGPGKDHGGKHAVGACQARNENHGEKQPDQRSVQVHDHAFGLMPGKVPAGGAFENPGTCMRFSQ